MLGVKKPPATEWRDRVSEVRIGDGWCERRAGSVV
jgi:hypothetical protein